MGNKLILTPSGFKTYELISEFTQQTSKGEITVPIGFKTDLASVPRLFWFLIPPFGKYSQASVIHDYLYRMKNFTRKEADEIFYELMVRYDTWKWKAKLMYLGVRSFGWYAWSF